MSRGGAADRVSDAAGALDAVAASWTMLSRGRQLNAAQRPRRVPVDAGKLEAGMSYQANAACCYGSARLRERGLKPERGAGSAVAAERSGADLDQIRLNSAVLLFAGQAFGFVERELPGEAGELFAAGSGWVRLELTGAEQDADAFFGELAYGVLNGSAAS